MKIKGEIVKKRPYLDPNESDLNCILFLSLDQEIEFDGNHLKMIPILTDDSQIPYEIGEKVLAEGEIEFTRIVTASGKRNLSPMPVLRLMRMEKTN